jgi:hypothetical protein
MNNEAKQILEKIRAGLPEIPQDELDIVVQSLERHAYSAHLDAHHSVRSILKAGGGSCSKTDLLVMSGSDLTNRSGKIVLPIHRLLCGSTSEGLPMGTLLLIRVAQFVATPLSADPVFATAVIKATQAPPTAGLILFDRDGNGLALPHLDTLEIEVMTWKPGGAAAAETPFSWICTVEAARGVFG